MTTQSTAHQMTDRQGNALRAGDFVRIQRSSNDHVFGFISEITADDGRAVAMCVVEGNPVPMAVRSDECGSLLKIYR